MPQMAAAEGGCRVKSLEYPALKGAPLAWNPRILGLPLPWPSPRWAEAALLGIFSESYGDAYGWLSKLGSLFRYPK